MKPASRSAVLVSLGALLAVLLMGCGGDDAPTGSSTDVPDSAAGGAAAEAECNVPDGLLDRFNLQRQLVLNLALAGGENLETVQSVGPPEPETFRSVADVLAGLDLSGIASNPQFDGAEAIVADLHTTADLLQAALVAGTDTADPAWQELTEFYTQEFFVRHNASVGYYLSEAGCV